MESNREPKELFKFYLDQKIQIRDNRPLFFRRMMRWRVNSKEYATPFSKKGLLRGYIKYGIFAYMAWHYTKQALFAPAHHGHHGAHGQESHGVHGQDSHGLHGHDSKDSHSSDHGHKDHSKHH